MKIFKSNLKITRDQQIKISSEYKIIHIQIQEGIPTLWYECNPEGESEILEIRMFGTGEIIQNEHLLDYIGTVEDGQFIWHFYRIL